MHMAFSVLIYLYLSILSTHIIYLTVNDLSTPDFIAFGGMRVEGHKAASFSLRGEARGRGWRGRESAPDRGYGCWARDRAWWDRMSSFMSRHGRSFVLSAFLSLLG
ncbi:hypothetical protein F5B18DRAFT_633090 [Nemania serpens]|nr:hypothetical protein F5B18DRAFT_633090 [Nemania serpens]